MSNRGPGRASATRSERRRAAVARRRRSARQTASQAYRDDRARRRRRAALVAGGVVAVVAVVVALVVLNRDDAGGPQVTDALTGTVLSESGTALAIDARPETYRVTYAIETLEGETVTDRTQDLLVRRPFEGVLDYSAPADGADGDAIHVVSQLGLYSYASGDAAPQIVQGLPTIALGDLRLDGVLDDLVGAGLLVPRERREVLGRECQVYRTGQSLETMQLAAPTDTDWSDACVDASGLLLEQVTFQSGKATGYEIATAVDTAAAATDDDFAITGDPLAVADGGTELAPIDADAAPAPGYWTPATAPAGYEHVGRYALRTLKSDDATTTTVGVAPSTVETYVDVYRDGASFITVHQGDIAQVPGTDTSLGTDADGGALGAGRVAFGLGGNTFVVQGDTWFVEITAPMSATDLGALARTFVSS